MAATHRHEQDMVRKCESAASKTTDPLEQLRLKCLARGAAGIKGLGRYDCSKNGYGCHFTCFYHNFERYPSVSNQLLMLLFVHMEIALYVYIYV